MFVASRIRQSVLTLPLALAAGLMMWPALAAAGPRSESDPDATHGSSASGQSQSSAGDRAESRAAAAESNRPSSGPAGDTRPPDGGSGRVDNDSRSGSGGRSQHGRGHYGGHHGGHYGGYGGYYGGYGGYYGGYPFGWLGSAYLYWGDSRYSRTVVYPNDRYGGSGAMDLDVSPEQAEVYLDGERIGRADDFDGHPALLWLEAGTYDLVVYLPGYRTIARQVSIYGGLIESIDDEMEPGESVRPEDLATKTHDRRDARIRDDRDRELEVEGREPRRGQGGQDWRVRRGRAVVTAPEADADVDEDRADDREDDSDDRGATIAGDTAAVRIEVEPSDASVYLDGRFVGTGIDLARLPGGIVIEPGEHQLDVVRPGRRSEGQRFAVRTGQVLELEVELDSQ